MKKHETDDEKITLKHELLNAAWSAKGKGLDNEYAVAYQAVREVFDREILPLFKAKVREKNSLLTQLELAKRWGISARTLERWRWLGEELRFVKIGGLVRYRLDDVEAYEASQTKTKE